MLETLKLILKNAAIITGIFMILFSVLEFSRTPDVIEVFQKIFKEKYLKTYLAVFFSALALQAIIFPLAKLIF